MTTTTNTTVANPLVQRVRIPGRRFKIPSGGVFYKDGELSDDVKDGELTILPMTMVDELVLKTPDKLLNGDGAIEVINRCVPQILKPWQIMSKDIDFIMICLRIVSYGEQLEIEHTHETCSHTVEKENGELVRVPRQYKINVSDMVNKCTRIDPTTINQVFSHELKTGDVVQRVRFQPMTFRNFIDVMQAQVFDDDSIDPEKEADSIIQSLAYVIESVDEINDHDMIIGWLKAMAPMQLNELNDRLLETLQWGPNMNATVKCVDCGEDMELAVPLDPLLFFS